WLGATLLLLCGVLTKPAAAQDPYVITGSVTDAESGGPLVGAVVQLRTSGSPAPMAGSVTDASGRFTLRARVAAGNYVLQFSALGRGPSTRPLALGATREVSVPAVALTAAALQLEELVVTGTGAPAERREVGNAISSVTGEEVARAPAAT